MSDIFEELGPVEGFAHRAEHAAVTAFEHVLHPHLARLEREHDDAQPVEPRGRVIPIGDVTHLSPSPTSGIMPCCGKTPFDVPRTDRITTDRALVTCPGDALNPQAPASHPASLDAAPAATPPGGIMSLTALTDDLRNDLTDGAAYVAGWVNRVQGALPGIVSTVDTVSSSTVGKLAETLAESVIPEPYESMLVGLVGDFAKRYGQPAVAAPVAPAPAAPVA